MLAVSCQVYLIGSRETLTQLLAGLGLIGLAASLAAQDTLKNFFGTLLLIGEHPFRIGEHISVQGAEGLVESVGFRSTRLRTFEDSLLTIPNSVMAAALIDNRGRQDLPALPHRRLAGLRDADRQDRRDARRPEGVRCQTSPGSSRTRSRSTSAASARTAWSCSCRSTSGWRAPPMNWSARDLLSREILEQAERLGVDVALAGPDGPPGRLRHRAPRGPSCPQARQSRTIGSTAVRPPRRRRAARQTRLLAVPAPSELREDDRAERSPPRSPPGGGSSEPSVLRFVIPRRSRGPGAAPRRKGRAPRRPATGVRL